MRHHTQRGNVFSFAGIMIGPLRLVSVFTLASSLFVPWLVVGPLLLRLPPGSSPRPPRPLGIHSASPYARDSRRNEQLVFNTGISELELYKPI